MREVIIYKGAKKDSDGNKVFIGVENDNEWIDAVKVALRMKPDKITLLTEFNIGEHEVRMFDLDEADSYDMPIDEFTEFVKRETERWKPSIKRLHDIGFTKGGISDHTYALYQEYEISWNTMMNLDAYCEYLFK